MPLLPRPCFAASSLNVRCVWVNWAVLGALVPDLSLAGPRTVCDAQKQEDNQCPWGVAPVKLTLSDGTHTLHAYLTPECAARDVPILSANSENRLKWRLDQMTGATVRLVRKEYVRLCAPALLFCR